MLKILFAILGSIILCFVWTLISSLFLYMGWNWGVVPALAVAKPLALSQVFWFNFGLTMLGISLKGTGVSVKE